MMADNDAVGKKGAKKQAGAKAPEAQPAPSAPAPAKKSALASQLQDITFRIQSPVNSPKPQPLDSPSMGVLDGKKKIDISTKTWSPKAAPHLASGLNGINMGSPLLRSNRGTPAFQPLDSGGGDRMGELRNEMKTLEAVLSAAVVQQNSPRVSPPRSSFSSPLSPRSPAARTPLFSPRSRAESVVDEDESGANDKGLFGDNNGWGKQAGASGSGVRVEDDTRVEEEAARIVAEAEAAKAAAEAAAVEAARRAEEEESRRRAVEDEERKSEEEKRRIMEEEVERKRLEEEKEAKRLQEEKKRAAEEEKKRLEEEKKRAEEEKKRLEEEKKRLAEEKKKWEAEEKRKREEEEEKRKKEEEKKEKKRQAEEAEARKKAAEDAVAAILKAKAVEEAKKDEELFRLKAKLEQEEKERKEAEEKKKKDEIARKKEEERLEKQRKEEEERREREREVRLENEVKRRTHEGIKKAMDEEAIRQKIEDEKKAAENEKKMKELMEEQQKKAKEMAIKAAEVTRIEAMARRAAEEKERSEKAARRQKEIDARDRRHAMALLRTPTTVNLGSPNLDLDLDDFDVDFDDSDSDRTASPVLDLLDDRLERSIEPMIPTSSAKICLPPPQPSISPLKRPFSPAKGPVMTSPPFSPAKGPVMTPGHFSPITGPVTTAAPLAFSPAFGFTPPDKKALLPGHQSPWIGSDRRSKGGLSPSELLAGVSSPGWEPDDHPGFGMNRASPPLISNSSPNGLLRGKGSSAGSPHPSISAPTRSIESVLAPVMLTTSPYKSPVPPQRSPSALFTPPAANNFGMGSPMPSPSQIVIVSSPTVPGYRITHTLGQCWGTAYIPISPDENLPALLNGMDERAQQLTQAGRRDAVKGLLNEAEAMRAMGLINLRFSAPVPSGVSEVQFNASGTAVMLERLPETKETSPPANYLTPRHNPLPPSTISDTPSPRNFTLPDSFDSFSPPMSSKRPSPSESNLISPLTDSPFSSPPTTLASLTERLNQKPLDAWAPAKMLIRDSSPARTPGGKGVYLLD